MAFMNDDNERLSIFMKGSRTGKRLDPQSTVCSSMCATPLLLPGGVRKLILKALFWSGQPRCRC